MDTVTLENIMLTLLVGVVAWLALTVQDSTVKIATLSEKVSHIEANSVGSYSLKDAQKDLQLRDTMIASLTLRVTALEQPKNG